MIIEEELIWKKQQKEKKKKRKEERQKAEVDLVKNFVKKHEKEFPWLMYEAIEENQK